MSKCPDCGEEMKPLAFSEFCANDCDRKPEAIETETTQKYGPFAYAKRCPKVPCGSLNVEQFITADGYHCWDCGAVWADPA